jgi:chromosome segregation ATPase
MEMVLIKLQEFQTLRELTASREKLQSSQQEISNIQKNLENSTLLSEEHTRLLEQNKKLEAVIANLKEQVNSARTQFEKTLSERDAEISKYKQELADASEKLLQEKSASGAHIANLQETIENIRSKLEKMSEDKLLVQNKVKDLEEANSEADKFSQELTQAAERLSEEKFMHEAEILTMQQNIGDLKSRIETLVQEKSLVTSWFTDLERVVEQGRNFFPEQSNSI